MSASLSRRTGLLTAAALGLSFVLFGLSVDRLLAHFLESKASEELIQQADNLQRSLPDLLERPVEFRREFFDAAAPVGLVKPLLSLVDDGGSVILESRQFRTVAAQAPFPVSTSFSSKNFKTARFEDARGNVWRLASARLSLPGPTQVGLRLNLALPVEAEVRLLTRFRLGVAGLGLLLLPLFFFIGHQVARRSLKPLADISAVAASLNSDQLRTRLSPDGWVRELGELGGAFNRMLTNLDEAFDRMQRHAAELSHELRTPLHNMILQNEVTLSTDSTPEKLKLQIESNLAELRRMTRTVESVMFLARAREGLQKANCTNIEVGPLLADLADFYGLAASQKNVSLVAEGDGMLWADSDLLRRALGNLLSNAIRHSLEGGRVTLKLEHAQGGCRLSVRDEAGNLPADVAQDPLQPFHSRGHSDEDHLGLGVSIAAGIARMHGGCLEYHCETGRFTSAELWLPGDVVHLSV